MRKSRFAQQQIIGILKEAEAKDVLRRHGVRPDTF